MRLLERDAELKSLLDGVRQAVAGQGVGIAVLGESGAGKSALVAAALEEVGRDVRVLLGHCDPLQTPRPLGPFRGLGLSEIDTQPGEAVRVSELCDRFYVELSTQPTVLVIEDLHWLDEVSAELLRFLARRVEAIALALVVTYRDLEIDLRHPVRSLLGDFASLEGLHSLPLRPLSVDAVGELTAGTTLDPKRVHEVTGGNPFFVTAVVREPDLPMPGSVRDAVLARIADVVPEDLEVLQLVATAPDGLDDRVLPSLGVDLPTLQRLDQAALLTRTAHGLAFRHELTRQAVLSTVPPGGAGLLHTRVLDGLERLEPHDPAVLTHHAVGARDSARALRYARIAAAESIAASSNSEAAAFTELALTNLPTSALPAERAGLLAQLTRQLYLTNRLAEAIAAARASIPLWDGAREPAGVAEAHAALAVLEYQCAHRRSSNDHAAKACEIAEASGSPATIARAHADAAMLAAVGSELAEASEHAARTLTAATEAGLRELIVAGHMMSEAGACLAGDAAARGRLLEWTEAARRDGWDELAWRGYVVVFLADFEWCNLRGAQRLVDDALAYVTDRDLAVARHWHLAFRSLLHLGLGRWSAAREDAERIRTEVAVGSIVPGYVLGLTALRCGDGDATPFLDDMWAKARGIDEPLRYLTSLSALAEAMWMTGSLDSRVTEFGVSHLAELSSTPDTRGSAGLLRVWLRRLGLEADDPGDVAEPHRLALDGQHAAAASWWRAAGDVFSEAMAFADSPDPEHRMHAVSLLDRAGAIGTADRLRVELRQQGLSMVPQRPRESTRINPGGLTNRQLDVARLVARGLSNGEIAAQLYISPKTADHHVSAILVKLQLASRRAVRARADELGLS